MADLNYPNNAERVAAILTDPATYFHEAKRRAWRSAEADVAAELKARATRRRNHNAAPRPEPTPGRQ